MRTSRTSYYYYPLRTIAPPMTHYALIPTHHPLGTLHYALCAVYTTHYPPSTAHYALRTAHFPFAGLVLGGGESVLRLPSAHLSLLPLLDDPRLGTISDATPLPQPAVPCSRATHRHGWNILRSTHHYLLMTHHSLLATYY